MMAPQNKTSGEDDVKALRSLLLLVVLALAGPALAQPYPNKPVKMIVPFAPAGPTDVIARLIAQKLSETWGQQVYVENIPGAGGNTGTATALRAPGDGYTILVVSTGFIINPSLYAKVPYAISDFTPISLVAASPNAVSVHPSFPAKSMKELIALVKGSPGKYSYAQPATGSACQRQHRQRRCTVSPYKLDRNDPCLVPSLVTVTRPHKRHARSINYAAAAGCRPLPVPASISKRLSVRAADQRAVQCGHLLSSSSQSQGPPPLPAPAAATHSTFGTCTGYLRVGVIAADKCWYVP
jgi:hypothetical protein